MWHLLTLSFSGLNDGDEAESLKLSNLDDSRDSEEDDVQPETVDDYDEYSSKEGCNNSGGAREGSNSHIQHLDAKSEETSIMNLPKLKEWSKDHPWLLVLGDPDGWVTMGATENECLIFFWVSIWGRT